MTDARRISMDRKGFSLLEMVMVLTILGILAVWITVGISSNASVVAETDTMRGHVRFAQTLAMANNTATWSVLFNGSSYTLRRNAATSPFSWPGENSATHTFPPEINLVQGAGELVFDAMGAPAADYTVSLSDGTRQEQIVVLGVTGLIP